MTEARADPPAANTSAELERRRVLVRDAVRWACLGGALVAAPVALLGHPALAVSVVLGTLLGAVNFVLLARGVSSAIDRTVFETERARRERPNTGEPMDPEEVVGRPRGAGGALRLAFVVILVAVMLWFPPTQPMGLAIGVVIVLVAASVAAVRRAD